MPRLLALLTLTTLLLPTPALARVKLITLPVRERVEVQLDHDNATLVEEERIVPLTQGVNQVDFSWANTRIDPSTIVFRVLGPADGNAEEDGKLENENENDEGGIDVNILSVTYPAGENALVWQVSSNRSASVVVRISYLLGGLTKSYNYRAVAANDESTLTLSQYLRVQNFAGEAYNDTEIYAGLGETFMKPLGANETKEMLVTRVEDVPITKTYTTNLHIFGWLDPAQNKVRVRTHYRLHNDADHNLGEDALPHGKVRIFQKDSPDEDATTAFLGEDWGDYTPVGNAMDLYLGVAQDIVVKRTVDQRDDTRVAGELYHRSVTLKYEIENFKDQAVTLNLAEQIEPLRQELGLQTRQPAEWIIGDATTLPGEPVEADTDQSHVTYTLDLPAREGDAAEKQTVFLQIVFKNQWN